MRAYDGLLKAVLDAHVFEMNKRPLESRVVASLLYLPGLSYRSMTYQTRIIEVNHVSICNWVHTLKGIISHVPRKERKIVVIDETEFKIQGRRPCRKRAISSFQTPRDGSLRRRFTLNWVR